MNLKTLKMIGLALALAPMAASAEEAAKPAETTPAAATETTVAKPKRTPRPRIKLTDEQRAEMKARREKFMAERRAKMEAKVLEIVKKYIPEEEKAKALINELQSALPGFRRPPAGRPILSERRQLPPSAPVSAPAK